MKMITLIVAVIISATSLERANAQGGSEQRSILPPGWRLVDSDPSRWAQHFVSPDGLSTFMTVAVPVDRDAASYFDAFASADGERVTYRQQGRGWIVVSGFKGEKIFYRKALLACDDVWLNFAFEYPAAQKRAFDDLVTRASKLLTRSNDPRCARSRR